MKKLDSVSFDAFLREKSPLACDSGCFDLREFDLITPAALVQLATACYAMAGDGRRPRIMTEKESVRGYLQRCGFVNVIAGVAGIEPAIRYPRLGQYNSLRGSNPMLIEVTRIASGIDLPDLLDRIVWVLRYRLKYHKHDAFDVTTAVSEICQNTFDHNSGTAGFIAMQVYGQGANRFLEIGVSDYGDGLITTLQRNPKNGTIPSDLDAIKMAMQLGTSEYDDPTRGTGLYHLLEITYKHAGSIQIKSGSAKVRYRMDKREGWAFAVSSVPGVHVALTLPTKDRS
ncbi:MAG: hypothetical protein C4576_12365 [Desulfobacteraceae bacterium]|nr:MAG: hypothetical protein C4576_12365 [Desulfobacteraceae bacterium]